LLEDEWGRASRQTEDGLAEHPLDGRVALVTGAGSGLGEATARVLASAGCAVACVDLRRDTAEAAAAGIVASGARAIAWACDIADADAVQTTVEAVIGRLGRLDILVNCAGVDHTLPLDDLTIAQWDHVLGVNLREPFLLAKAVWPGMRRQGSGHIVNVASTAAVRVWSGALPYHASKWGLVGLSRALGVEGRPYGIRSTTIIPGGMRTHFFDRFAAQGIPLPDTAMLQDPATVARLILVALEVPPESALQELIVTPVYEGGWP